MKVVLDFVSIAKMDSTVRYLGVDLDDALSLLEGIDLSALPVRVKPTKHVAKGDVSLDFALGAALHHHGYQILPPRNAAFN